MQRLNDAFVYANNESNGASAYTRNDVGGTHKHACTQAPKKCTQRRHKQEVNKTRRLGAVESESTPYVIVAIELRVSVAELAFLGRVEAKRCFQHADAFVGASHGQ